MNKYFVLTNSDGDIYIQEVDKSVLETRLEQDYYGSGRHIVGGIAVGGNLLNERLGDDEILIIKGEIVVPTAKEVAVKFELP